MACSFAPPFHGYCCLHCIQLLHVPCCSVPVVLVACLLSGGALAATADMVRYTYYPFGEECNVQTFPMNGYGS
ncbi:MAG: hypothetical protein EOO65_03285 [Methanosarcinales archaeon]|nr:MAG: hypothetical protein EOO65_03285 [Methanosarcinales archaeon]